MGLPTLPAMQAVVLAAELGSVSAAAQKLGLTQSAVSRQIAQAEAALGVTLFDRVRQRIAPTEAGRRFAAEAGPLLNDLFRACRTVGEAGQSLTLAVLPSFATRWLVPRLPDFHARYPKLRLDVVTRLEPFDFIGSGVDAAIHAGPQPWPGARLDPLFGETVVPVASARFRQRYAIAEEADLLNAPRLDLNTRPQAWADWFAAGGFPIPEPLAAAFRFEQFLTLAEAAVYGLGAALVPRFLIEPDLASGRLEVLFSRGLSRPGTYALAYPPARIEHPTLRRFRAWLLAQAAPAGTRAILP
ncbi:MAG: LysR family transcriptional regulator [Elstera sp.]